MKKTLILCTALLVLMCGIIGCGKKDNTSTVTPTVEATPTATEAPTATPTPSPVPTPPEVYLRELFAEHGMKVGTCLTTQMINNKLMSELIVEQYSSVTMENSMKPDYIFNKEKSIETGDLVVEFNTDMVQMLDWAKENEMAVRGHTLVWYSQTPAWIFYEDFDQSKELVSREVMLARLDSYMKQVFSMLEEQGYSDIIYAYDVVNEAIMEDGKLRMQMNNWYATIGDDFILQAFITANRYAPENIALFYNDYNEQFKTQALVDLVKSLVDEDGNSLIDGIGFQAHLYTEDNLTTYFKTVDALAELGITVEITELDVSLGAWQHEKRANEETLAEQGRYYYNLINGILERKDSGKLNIDALTFWGVSDGQSWRKSASPLLYNSAFMKKPAFYGAAQLKDFAGFTE